MKVKELIGLLKQYDNDSAVKIHSDIWGSPVDVHDIDSNMNKRDKTEPEEVYINVDIAGY